MEFILNNKPVLVGLHLALAIIGIDLFLWLAGELIGNPLRRGRLKIVAPAATVSFALSWLLGGYYYVKYYGVLVKPGILAGAAPWAHGVAMEAKEHIFLFLLPMALTAVFLAFLPKDALGAHKLKGSAIALVGSIAGLALAIGAMGYIISAAARWAG